MPKSRAGRAAYYCVPMLFCLAVHWIALKTWFYSDDFAWLGLRLEVQSPHDLWEALFSPRAQGTIRTISERLYFLSFSSLFGMNALPPRLWTFLTQFANIALLMAITRRITGSALAGFIAPILWSATAALAFPMHWSSAYNEICCAFFMLLAFYLFLRYIETGQTKFWVAQWVVFLLGFGALELNVMYPALAFTYALCCARSFLRRTLPLFIPSVAFTLFHFIYVPMTKDPIYAMHFDVRMLHTFWNHWAFTIAAARPASVGWQPVWLGYVFAIVVTIALLAFVLVRVTRRDLRGVFFLAWFVLVILPVLPLSNHSSEYYPAIPSIGIAMLAAWALASSRFRAIYAVAAIYLMLAISDVHSVDLFFYVRAREMKHLIQGLEATRNDNAGKKILLNGVSNALFESGFWDDPFRLIGIHEIYLTPGSEKSIAPHPEWEGVSRLFISTDSAIAALNKNQAVVYAVSPGGIQNVTSTYKAIITAESLAQHRETVDVGNPIYAERLGPGWYRVEHGLRWMTKSASVQLSGPKTVAEHLSVQGVCPQPLLEKGPLTLTLSADGARLGSATLNKAGTFQLQFPLPADLVGKYAVVITAEVSRTLTPANDPRQLGLLFGIFSIH
ncbi:MAG: glycosyltransferase family 39 protein [Acidobacteriota bacterium]|nr:glycosyltransferase family 39 protein [Acidobacteriota bacterium]